MEKKMNNDGRILETAYNIIEQVNILLISAANPSDETSLFIRLSLIKVSRYIFEVFSLVLLALTYARIICCSKNFLLYLYFYFLNIFLISKQRDVITHFLLSL